MTTITLPADGEYPIKPVAPTRDVGYGESSTSRASAITSTVQAGSMSSAPAYRLERTGCRRRLHPPSAAPRQQCKTTTYVLSLHRQGEPGHDRVLTRRRHIAATGPAARSLPGTAWSRADSVRVRWSGHAAVD